MAEKLREAAARGDAARVARLLDEDIKPLPDEVSPFPLYCFRFVHETLVARLLQHVNVACLIYFTPDAIIAPS